MDKAVSRFLPCETKTMVILVDSYEERVMRGRIRNPCFPHGEIAFVGLTDMLLTIDKALDEMAFPQAEFEPRSITRNIREHAARFARDSSKAIATLHLRVIFRRGASWQGELMWAERDIEAEFRSVLELAKLTDEILTEASASAGL